MLSVEQSVDSEEDSDVDTGFYSEGEGPVPPRRQSSGLCVAFRFPVKKSSALKTQTATAEPKNGKPAAQKSRGVGEQRRPRGVAQLPTRPRRGVVTAGRRGKDLSEEEEEEEEKEVSEEEDEPSEDQTQALSKRARNIQENKAMVRKMVIVNTLSGLELSGQISEHC